MYPNGFNYYYPQNNFTNPPSKLNVVLDINGNASVTKNNFYLKRLLKLSLV